VFKDLSQKALRSHFLILGRQLNYWTIIFAARKYQNNGIIVLSIGNV
jgi:hypothetical protein